MTGEPGLRERKKQQTAHRIEEAAVELFQERGFDATTVDEIAAKAEISSRTFFHYFATKEDVILGDYATRLTRVTETLRQQSPQTPPWEALGAAFATVAIDYEAHQHQLRRRFGVMMTAGSVFARSLQLQAGWEDAVTDVLSDRLDSGPNDIAPRLLAASALGAMRSSVRHWLQSGDRPLPELMQDCFDQLGDGLSQIGSRD